MRKQRSTILCIDDQGNSLEDFKALLELDGYDVLTATSACNGLEVLASRCVDGVTLDHHMLEVPADVQTRLFFGSADSV